ncbi:MULTISPECIES: CGNR zinc finger domain-containing protein [unclassified Kribbella]|uniref:CGNR zinc finger domain-containing protein n=1 Tax=unclassified Kribbella TaxID=2644121 RepID=UPI0033D7686B
MADRMDFRFDLGATWLNLLATRGTHFGEHPVERMPTVERFAEWLDRVELRPTRKVTAEDLASAHELRETLRPIALATVDGVRPSPADVKALGRFLDADPLQLKVTDRLTRSRPTTATESLSRIARQAADHLTGPERHFLAACPEQDCRGVFSDPSGRRRWCPNPTCATRGRVRAHRARKARSDNA